MSGTHLQTHFELLSLRTRLLTVEGELDIVTTPRLETALQRAIGPGGTDVLVDLRGVSFIDMRGLQALLRAHHRAGRRGGSITLVYSHGPVLRLLELTELITTFPRDLSDRAIASLQGRATRAHPARPVGR